MNQYLREYFRRSNHSQRILRACDGSWFFIKETGSALAGCADLFWAKPEASSFAEFVKIGCLFGPDGLLAKTGAQVSGVMCEDGMRISFCSQNNIFQSHIHLNRTNHSVEIKAQKCNKIIDIDNGECLPGNINSSFGLLFIPWALQYHDGRSSVGISICNGNDLQNVRISDGNGAFAPIMLCDSNKNIHITWAQADERLYYAVIPLKQLLSSSELPPLSLIATDARQPAMVEYDNGMLIVYENHLSYPCSVYLKNAKAIKYPRLTEKDIRFDYAICHSLNLVKDKYGVPTLFFAENHRDISFCTRWLGSGWGPIQSIASIFHDNPRSDYIFKQVGRLEVTQKNNVNNDIGLLLQSEDLTETVFVREPIIDLGKVGSPINFYDLKELTEVQDLELTIVKGNKSDKNPLIQPGDKGAFNSGRAVNSGTFIWTDQKWQAWFAGMPADIVEGFEWWKALYVGHAMSENGVNWNLTNREIDDVPFNAIPGLPCQPIVLFDKEETDSQQRYKMVYFLIAGEKEVAAQNNEWNYLADLIPGFLYTSPDGIHWKTEKISLKCPGGMWLEHCPMCLLRDETDPSPNRKWKTYGYTSLNLGRRACSLATSADLRNWVLHEVPVLASEERGYPLVPSGPYSQVHGMEVNKLGNAYIGIVQNQYNAHSYDLELAVSRDGLHFNNVLPGTPLVSQGKKGCWDSAGLRPAGMNILDNEIRIYYIGTNDHPDITGRGNCQSSVGFISFPVAGLTGLKLCDGVKNGTFTTVPIKVDIEQKYELSFRGYGIKVRAEVIDANNLVLKGHSFSDCESRLLLRDTTIMTWRGGSTFCSLTDELYFRFEIVQDKASYPGCLLSFKVDSVL